jgi:hypothetical protein
MYHLGSLSTHFHWGRYLLYHLRVLVLHLLLLCGLQTTVFGRLATNQRAAGPQTREVRVQQGSVAVLTPVEMMAWSLALHSQEAVAAASLEVWARRPPWVYRTEMFHRRRPSTALAHRGVGRGCTCVPVLSAWVHSRPRRASRRR